MVNKPMKDIPYANSLNDSPGTLNSSHSNLAIGEALFRFLIDRLRATESVNTRHEIWTELIQLPLLGVNKQYT